MTLGMTIMTVLAQTGNNAGDDEGAWMKVLDTLGRSLNDSAFWIGFLLVLLFAANRFAVTEERSDDIDPPLAARSFTTRFRYHLSAAAYVGCYEVLYIALVAFGSFPEFQELLTQWIGSLQIPEHEGEAIGTPAWAALATSSLFPSVPGFRNIDTRARKFLHSFASIPQKAHTLAGEILAVVANEPETEQSREIDEKYAHLSDEDRALIRQLHWLSSAVELLQDGANNPGNAVAYSGFFSRHSDAYRRAEKKAKELMPAADTATGPSPVLTRELKDLVARLARFLSCALLWNEPSERALRETIRTKLELQRLPVLPFSFNLRQMIAGGILIIALTIGAGFLALFVVYSLQKPTPSVSTDSAIFILSWVPYAVFMLLPPFVIAAGARLYFADQRQSHDTNLALEDQIVAVSALAIAAYALGILPPLAGMAIENRIEGTQWLFQILPYGLTPAALACIFFYLSTWRATRSPWRNFAVDFGIFAIVSAGLIWFATWIATDIGNLSFADVSKDRAFNDEVALKVLPITAGILAGLLGAFQCLISRQMTEPQVVTAGNRA